MSQPSYEELLQGNRDLQAQVAALEQENAQLRQELEELRQQLTDEQDDPGFPSAPVSDVSLGKELCKCPY